MTTDVDVQTTQQQQTSNPEYEYPSPKQSCPPTPKLTDYKVSKRKSTPSRSLSNINNTDEKYLQGIVTLDVYSVYKDNPKMLLSRTEKKDLPFDLSNFKNTRGAPEVVWKKDISPDEDMYDQLTPEEIRISSTLRVLPLQYLHIKETILTQVHKRGPFKKRDAKSWFRIDTAILFDWFKALGWIPSDDEWEKKKMEHTDTESETYSETTFTPSEGLLENLLPFTPPRERAEPLENTRVMSLFLKALLSLIFRLWIATLTVSVLMYFVRRVPLQPIVHHSGKLVREQILEANIIGEQNDWQVTPALFGIPFATEITGTVNLMIGPVASLEHNACLPFTFTDNIKDNDTLIGMVIRGGCEFDRKVFHMQNAGFTVALIYNNDNEQALANIRMSSHSMGDKVQIMAGFMNLHQASQLLDIIEEKKTPTLKITTPYQDWINKKIIISGLIDMLLLFVLVVVTGTAFLLLGLAINIGHNLVTRGQLLTLETIYEASVLILAISPTTNPPKLDKITFPTKILAESDLTASWKEGGIAGHESCPICIEEFEVGNVLRELPCHHVFHDTCVDPWLLGHNRLCPVCKQDVLKVE
ncbi:hypothetical protein HDV06_004594 [Boothiomyces sp. JEL0866]|nr:hypothetical protein HDV06_004594 [Boothiomyces sp. JEL0866]